ncbi:MAG: dephospho-CoA kinase [Candidatus Omnitrophota bacterium]
MIIIGLTGSIASGKTTAAKLFKKKGAAVIDADKIVHRLYGSCTECRNKIKKTFGEGILNKDKTINRKCLGKIVFSDIEALEKLCGIVHPLVIHEIKSNLKLIKLNKKKTMVVIDAPLLFETGLDKLTDFNVCVSVPKKIMIKRLFKKGILGEKEIMSRLKNQMPVKEKKSKSDFIINNAGSFSDLYKEIENILKKIKKRMEKK